MNRLIAIVDDDPDIRNLIAQTLRLDHFRTTCFGNGKAFLQSLTIEPPDLAILDVMLPDTDGFEVCRSVRSIFDSVSLPIILLSARVDELDTILGLELGADDYMTKPFSIRELAARVRSILRRPSPVPDCIPITIEDELVIQPLQRIVLHKGQQVPLTTTEFRILHLLAAQRGTIFSRETIIHHLWGTGSHISQRNIDVHITNIRKKLSCLKTVIRNSHGRGYEFSASTLETCQ